MTGRLFIISNRVPTDGPPSGGLVVALHDCLKARGGTWIGTSGDLIDRPQDNLRSFKGDGYSIKAFDLTHDERRDYYLGYANSVLWPLCHRRTDLMALSDAYYDSYIGVNRRLAAMLARLLRPDDQVWIHDYHFLPLAQCLRDRGVAANLGYFHHIPFPAPTDLMALPEQQLFYSWLSHYDLIGLQTQNDVATALDLFRRHDRGELLMDGRVSYQGRSFAFRSFPIGIDATGFQQEAARSDSRALLRLGRDEKLIIGVDRLDYSKGLDNRLRAYGQYLDNSDNDGSPRASLLQIAPPSRQDVQAYREIRREMEHTAGRLNGLHSQLGWTPIQYIHRPLARQVLAGLYRGADVALVTPLADGMNLVAKEYVAAQDPDDPGVLILSHFAGAAEQLTGAIMVNPHNIGQMASAIDQALTMPLADRQARYREMHSAVFDQDIAYWTDSFLQALAYDPADRAVKMGILT